MYRPTFTFDSEAPDAQTIFSLWMYKHRYLPRSTSEPERLADLIEAVIGLQSRRLDLVGLPSCALHSVRMVLLGRLGKHRQKHILRLTISEAVRVPGKGMLVLRGIFRCPVPGCYRVGTLESSEGFEPRRPVRATIQRNDTWLS